MLNHFFPDLSLVQQIPCSCLRLLSIVDILFFANHLPEDPVWNRHYPGNVWPSFPAWQASLLGLHWHGKYLPWKKGQAEEAAEYLA